MSLHVVCVYTVDEHVTHAKPLRTGSELPFGIAFIATVLRESGHEVTTLVLARNAPLDQILTRTIKAVQPQMFCMTSVSTQFRFISAVAEKVKIIDPRIYVFVGGHHASMNPDDVIASAYIDAICVGEGEKAVIDLADRLERGEEPSGIQNLWIKHAGSNVVEKNSLAPFNEDLDKLPFIDREMWRPWIEEPDLEPAILVGRGCPNSCSYCSNQALRKLTTGRYVRFRSPGNVIAELDGICKNQSITSIYLEVETLSANLQYAFDLCEALAEFNSNRKTPIRFHVNVALASALMRDHNILDRLLQAFVRANLMTINVGLESGSERIRNEVLKRPHYRNEEFIQFCLEARTAGIRVHANVIIGIPEETLAEWQQTVAVLRESRVDNIIIGIFYPYPGTTLGDRFSEATRRQGGSDARERRAVVVALPGFSRSRIATEFVLSYYRVFKGNWPFTRVCAWTARKFISVHPVLENLYLWLSRRSGVGRRILNSFRS